MVLRESMVIVVRLVAGTSGRDRLSRLLADATAIFVAVAATAALVPALRASHVDPIQALHYE